MGPPRRTTPARLLVALLVALLAALAVAPITGARIAEPTVDTALERGVFTAINQMRRTLDLPPLRRSADLTAAARAHAIEMGTAGFFSHSSADGTSATRRIAAFYGADGSDSWSVSEVIQWASREVTPEEALEAWLGSDHHRRELLRPGWRDVGIGAVRVENASGAYGGRDVTLLVVDFGRR